MRDKKGPIDPSVAPFAAQLLTVVERWGKSICRDMLRKYGPMPPLSLDIVARLDDSEAIFMLALAPDEDGSDGTFPFAISPLSDHAYQIMHAAIGDSHKMLGPFMTCGQPKISATGIESCQFCLWRNDYLGDAKFEIILSANAGLMSRRS